MSSFIAKLQKRLAKEESGFTLIELLIVLVIIGILLAIAVPSYLGFKDRANDTAAKANVRASIPAVEAYYADHGDYAFNLSPTNTAVGTAIGALQLIDQGVTLAHAKGTGTNNVSYCVDATVGNKSWNKAGPAASIATGLCP
jgi:type IV pilus assembly protein PilA